MWHHGTTIRFMVLFVIGQGNPGRSRHESGNHPIAA